MTRSGRGCFDGYKYGHVRVRQRGRGVFLACFLFSFFFFFSSSLLLSNSFLKNESCTDREWLGSWFAPLPSWRSEESRHPRNEACLALVPSARCCTRPVEAGPRKHRLQVSLARSGQIRARPTRRRGTTGDGVARASARRRGLPPATTTAVLVCSRVLCDVVCIGDARPCPEQRRQETDWPIRRTTYIHGRTWTERPFLRPRRDA